MLLGRALLETGKAGRVFAIGSDLFDESVKLLRDGVLNNLVEKAPYAQGYLGARYLVENMLLGKLPEREAIYVGSQMVFRSGLKVYEQDTYRAQAL
jgi:ABC-type sugar transport system substrate-binding protein